MNYNNMIYNNLIQDDLYDNLARRQEKENRRNERTAKIEEYEEYTWTGPSTAITVFGIFYYYLIIE